MRSLFLATPIKDSMPGPVYQALTEVAIAYTKAGGRIVPRTTWLSSNVSAARSTLAHEALEDGAEAILWVDDDVLCTVEDVLTLLRLELGDDPVSGFYRQRTPERKAVGLPLDGGENRGALIEMAHTGFGFLLMPRRCLERMANEYGPTMFEMPCAEGKHVGEDEIFCNRWRALGGRVWLHAGVQLGHIGPHIFR